MAAVYLLYFLAFLVIFYYANRRLKYGRLPPGPLGVPFLGSILYLSKNTEIQLFALKKEYGNLITVYLGSTPVIVLNDWTVVKDALVNNANTFNGRPKMFLPEKIVQSKDIVFDEGERWKAKRRITLGILRDFGFGKTSLETNVVEEIQTFTELNLESNEKITISRTFTISLINIIWSIVAGQRLSPMDKELKTICHDFDAITKDMLGSAPANIFPFLRYIPKFSGSEAIKCARNIDRRVTNVVEFHKTTYETSECRDFIDGYLSKTLYNKDNTKPIIEYDDNELRGIVNDLFGAALETTDTFLSWAVLYLMEYPHVQRKIQNEIDIVIGPDRVPNYSDRFNLPYISAFIAEVQRISSLVPLSVPYKTTRAIKFQGYDIPRGIQVWANLYAVHYDKDLWGDPENFRPERFLKNENEFKEPEYLIPFSTGSRQCLGETVARMEIFLFLTIFLQKYNIRRPENDQPSFERETGGAVRPLPFNAIFQSRIKKI